jgi:sugar lactone lactonase YvrE
MTAFELAWDSRCEVGESPVWDAAARRLIFADIPTGRLHVLSVDSGARVVWTLPEMVGSFGLCRSGRIIAALRHRVVLFDPRTGAVETLAGPVEEPETNRFNDGKVGPDGCFWVGSMDDRPDKSPTGALYRVTPEGRMEKRYDGFTLANGLAWTPDGTTMFHACSVAGTIDAWDFDPATGRIGNNRRLATLTLEDGLPDGAACDAEGTYWSAGVFGSCLNRFSPRGELLAKIPFPVPTPTMPCFAEDTLYVTSLWEGRDAALRAQYPTMGGLFRGPSPVRGAPIGLFADR